MLKAGHYAGGLIVSTPVVIRGAGRGVTAISGGGKHMRPVVQVDAAPVTITGVTITGGTVSSTASGSGYGGGVITEPGAVLSLDSSSVEGNQDNHGAGGGGINSLGITNCVRCNITNNSSYGTLDQAGGIHVGSHGVVNMIGGAVKSNIAGWGGGFDIDRGGSLTLNGTSVWGNTAAYQGGGIDNNGVLTINGGRISENTANQGGGIMDNGAATLDSSNVLQNIAKRGVGYGGGIFVTSGNTVTLHSTLITNNKTDNFVRA